LVCFAYVIGSLISIQGGVDVFGAKLFVDIQKFRRARAAASPSHKDEAQTATRR